VRGVWVHAGVQINAVGAYQPAHREIDTALMVRSRLYVDRRESAMSQAGEFVIPREEGAIGDDHIVGEIGEVLVGKAPGRNSPDEITLFKSLGIAVEDLAAARHVYDKAVERSLGTWVEIGGRHFGSTAEG
jgi:alanine dehydrogenase